MNCYYCNSPIGDDPVCPVCRSDQKAYRMILSASNYYYNEGLMRAQIRDLCGAAESLNRSLRYNKMNIDARNLLGLVYFEIGELVLALREWVLSKNLQPEDNAADRYLDEIQNGAGMLEKLNSTTKKYNQALQYCREGNRDLARIQLRRVLSNNPNMVRAHQLLALLYIQDGEYNEARKTLSAAAKIDVKNPLTISYQKEVRRVLKERQEANKRKKHRRNTDPITFQDGNDTVMMPRQTFIEALDNSRSGIINLVIGIVLGVLVCVFLIVPTVRQNANNDAANALVDANNDASKAATNVTTLQEQVADLQSQLDAYEGKSDMKTSYEKLLEAQSAYNSSDLEGAAAAIAEVNRDLLDTQGQTLYDTIIAATNDYTCSQLAKDASSKESSGDYAGAAESYLQIVTLNESYDNGEALYSLAKCYEKSGDTENALKYYQRVVELFPNSYKGRTSESKITALQGQSQTTSTDTENTAVNQ